MDPLSIIASSLALLGATSASLKIVRKILKANKELGILLAEVEEVEIVLRAADTAIRERQTHPNLPQLPINAIVEYVGGAHDRLQELHDLIDDKFIKAYSQTGDAKVARIAWAKEKSTVHTLQQGLREIRTSLPGIWGAANISTLTHMSLRLEEMFQLIALHPAREEENDSRVEIDRSEPTKSDHLVQEVRSEADADGESEETARVIIVRNMEEYRTLPERDREKIPQAYTAARIRAPSYRMRRCDRWCSCICHDIRNVQTPKKSSFLIGLLSISYSGFKLWNENCSEHCESQSDPSFRATYFLPEWLSKTHFLPEWLVSRAIHFAVSMNTMKGIDHTLRTPRVIPASAEVFSLAVQGKLDEMRILFARGEASPWDVAQSTGRGVLAHAVTYNHQELAQFLIDSGADPDAEEHDRRSSVAIAWTRVIGNFVAQETIDTWRSMFDYETHLESRMYPPLTKIILGLTDRNIDLREQLQLSSRGIDEVDAEGRTALSWAAARGELEVVKTLLEFRADPNVRNHRGQSPLHFATQNEYSGCGPIARALLDGGANVNFADHWKRTALIYGACNQKQVRDLEPLIDFGANVNAQDLHERTPLSYAAKMNRTETLPYLLEKDCDPCIPDNWGLTPLMEAIQLNQHAVVRILLRYQRSTSSRSQKRSILEQVALKADLETMSILSDSNFAEFDSRAFRRRSPTSTEMFEQRSDITDELRTAFESLLRPDPTPLHTRQDLEADGIEEILARTIPGAFPSTP